MFNCIMQFIITHSYVKLSREAEDHKKAVTWDVVFYIGIKTCKTMLTMLKYKPTKILKQPFTR